jgi:protein involved in polysaccharide export with SLBB domain
MTDRNAMLRFGWTALFLLMPLARPAAGQTVPEPNLATRAQLQQALTRLQGERGAEARAQAVRDRLDHGDFRAGDRIFIRLVGEPVLTDTFTVAEGPELPFPQIGALPLAGVLRSELSGQVQTYLAHYFRDPVVHVRPLVRIMVEGDVARPGYYALSPDQPLADAITAAGGITQHAAVDAIRIERGTAVIWGGVRLQEAMGQGSSLDQLNLQAGDRLLVPPKGPSLFSTVTTLLVLIPAAIYAVTLVH